MNRDPDQSERQQKQPYDRIKNDRQKRQRPAHYEEKAPEQKSEHVRFSSTALYVAGGTRVPGLVLS